MNSISIANIKRIIATNHEFYKLNRCQSELVSNNPNEIRKLALYHLCFGKPYVLLSPLDVRCEIQSKMITRLKRLRKRKNCNNSNEACKAQSQFSNEYKLHEMIPKNSKPTKVTSKNSLSYKSNRAAIKIKSTYEKAAKKVYSKHSLEENPDLSSNVMENPNLETIPNWKVEQLSEVTSSQHNMKKSGKSVKITDESSKIFIDFNREDIIKNNLQEMSKSKSPDRVTSSISPEDFSSTQNSESTSILRVEAFPSTSSKSEIDIQVQLPPAIQSKLGPGKYKIFFDLSKVDFGKAVSTNLSENVGTNIEGAFESEIGSAHKTKTHINKNILVPKRKRRQKQNIIQFGIKNKKQKQEKSDLVKFIEEFSDDCTQSIVSSNLALSNNMAYYDNITTLDNPVKILGTDSITSTTENIPKKSQTQEEASIPVFLTNYERGEWVRTMENNSTVSATSTLNQVNCTDILLSSVSTSDSTNFQNHVDDNFVLPTDIEADAMRFVEYIENNCGGELPISSAILRSSNTSRSNTQNNVHFEEHLSIPKNTSSVDLVMNKETSTVAENCIPYISECRITNDISVEKRKNELLIIKPIQPEINSNVTRGDIVINHNGIPFNKGNVQNISEEVHSTITCSRKGNDMPLLNIPVERFPIERDVCVDVGRSGTNEINEKIFLTTDDRGEEETDYDADVLSLFAFSPLGSPSYNMSEDDSDQYDSGHGKHLEQATKNIKMPLSEINNCKITEEEDNIYSSRNNENRCNFVSESNANQKVNINISKSTSNIKLSEPLKYFKIPKIVKTKSTNISACTPIFERSKSTNVHQSYQSVLSLSSSNSTLSGSISTGHLPVVKRNVHILFGNLCFAFLNDSCNTESCKYNHNLVDKVQIKSRLSHLNQNALDAAYRFTWRNFKLFLAYYPLFCEIYAEKKNQTKLLQMIIDCEMYTTGHIFFKNIANGLVETGLSRNDAIMQIINRCTNKTNEVKDFIIDMIIEFDPLKFTNVLESYSNMNDYNFQISAITRLAEFCNRTKNFELTRLILKILINIPKDILMNNKSDHIMEFLLMVQNCKDLEVKQ